MASLSLAAAGPKGDKAIEVAEETGPALAQNDIDNLFSAARTGDS